MLKNKIIAGIAVAGLLFPLVAHGKNLPRVDGKPAVATIDGKPITLQEFNEDLMRMHRAQAKAEKEKKEKAELAADTSAAKAGKIDYRDTLNRIINLKLILLEAHNIGIDQLPDVKAEVDKYAKDQLMKDVVTNLLKNVKPDPKIVDEIYQRLSQQGELKSVLFQDKEKAKDFVKKIAKGEKYEALAKKVLADRTATGTLKARFYDRSELLPVINEKLSRMKVGETSPVFQVASGYTVFKLLGWRHKDDPNLKKKAERLALEVAGQKGLGKIMEQLRNEYTKVYPKVIDGIDYSPDKANIDDLLKDKRVIAEIIPPVSGIHMTAGAEKVTVGDLTRILKEKFFHGLGRAMKKGRANKLKRRALDNYLEEQALVIEGRRLGLDKAPDYVGRVEEYRKATVFGKFLAMVIAPEVNVTASDIKKEYDTDKKDYSTPRMFQLNSIAFADPAAARKALEKFDKGTDFAWLKANADGRVLKPKTDQDQGDKAQKENTQDDKTQMVEFNSDIVTEDGLPGPMQSALADLKAGDTRIYKGAGTYTYLVNVQAIYEPKPQDFAKVKGTIRDKLFGQRMKEGVEKYASELRKHYKVKILDASLK